MEIWCDTANIELIKEVASLDISTGVTTNPIIFSEPQRAVQPLLQDLLEAQQGWVAVQTTKTTANAMLEEAKRLHDFSNRIIVKVPMIKEGIKAMAAMQRAHIPTLATAVFRTEQMLLAAKIGVDYVAPYLSHMTKQGLDSLAILTQMQTIIEQHNFKTKIMAASLGALQDLNTFAALGLGAVTVPERYLTEWLSTDRLTQNALQMFEQPWTSYITAHPDPLFTCSPRSDL